MLKASQQVIQERVWSEDILIDSIVETDLAPTPSSTYNPVDGSRVTRRPVDFDHQTVTGNVSIDPITSTVVQIVEGKLVSPNGQAADAGTPSLAY